MSDLIGKLQDLNRRDKTWRYKIEIHTEPETYFMLIGVSPTGCKKTAMYHDAQQLREGMYKIILNWQNGIYK